MLHARPDYNRIQDPAGLIPANEPVFLLRGQDVSAPIAVAAWANANDAKGGDPALSEAARDQARRMYEWQADRKAKAADMTPEQATAAAPPTDTEILDFLERRAVSISPTATSGWLVLGGVPGEVGHAPTLREAAIQIINLNRND